MQVNFAGTMKSLLGGLLVALIGAFVGSVLLSTIIVGCHTVYINTVVPYAIRDGQWESFALIGTIPYGALLGIIAAATIASIYYLRHGDGNTAALVFLRV